MRPDTELEQLRAESASLRYELARLHDRRTVRAALALTGWRRSGLSATVAALRGRAPRADVPGPSVVALHPPFPHLRVASTGPGVLLAGACVAEQLTPTTALPLVARDRPDLLLVDEVTGWGQGALPALLERVRGYGGRVVTVGQEARAAVPAADLHVAIGQGTGADLELPAAVDVRRWSPVGLLDDTPAHRIEGARGLDPATARRQPVVVLPPGPALDALAPAAAGAVPVAGPGHDLGPALVGLDATTRELVEGGDGDGADQAERAEHLLADDELRRRVSVRLRRHVQRHCSTHRAVEEVVAALGWDAPPSRRISVLLATRRPDRLSQVLDDLAHQRHDDVELVLLPHGDAPVPGQLPPGTQVRRVGADRPLGAVLDAGVELVTGRYVAKVDDDDRYGADHLGDLVDALRVSGATLVGRRVHAVHLERAEVTVHPPPGGEERFEDHLPGGTLLLRADTLRATRWRHVPRAVDTELIRAIHLAGGSAYTSHRYGYVRIRHDHHTYDAPDGWTGQTVPGFDPRSLEA